jgi:hypothetical protein
LTQKSDTVTNTVVPPVNPTVRRRQHLVAFWTYLLLTCIFFSPVIFQHKTFTTVRSEETAVYPWAATLSPISTNPTVQSDQADLYYPWQTELNRAVHDSTLPFWDPDTFGGYPLYANGSSGELYPPRLVAAAVLSPNGEHELETALALFFEGFFTYLFLRELEVGIGGALFAGVAWMFCNFNMAWLQLEINNVSQVLLPLTLLLVHRAWRKRALTSSLLAGVCLGATMMAGHILWVGITCAIAGIYSVGLAARSSVHARKEGRRAALAPWTVPTVIGLSALGIAALVLLPTIHALSYSQRAAFSYTDLYKVVPAEGGRVISPPSVLFNWLFPWSGRLNGQSINLNMVFAGTFTGLFALLGFFTRRPGTALGRWLALGIAFIAIGGPVTWIGYHLIPILRVFWPYGRLFGWANFGLIILAGIGFDRAVRFMASKRHSVLRHGQLLLLVTVVAVTTLQLIPEGWNLNPSFASSSATTTFPATGLIKAMESYQREAPWPARILPVSSNGGRFGYGVMFSAGDYGLVDNLDVVGGYDSSLPASASVVTKYLEGQPVKSLRRRQSSLLASIFDAQKLRYSELSRFGISALASLPQLGIWETWGGPPRYKLYERLRYARPDGVLIGLSTTSVGPRVESSIAVVPNQWSEFLTYTKSSFNWQHTAVLDKASFAELPSNLRNPLQSSDTLPLQSKVTAVLPGINTMTMTVSSNKPGVLVVPENWDPGWTATVNGTSEPVLEGNYLQQMIAVPEGTSHVVFRYRPPGFNAGVLISIFTIFVIVAIALSRPYRRRFSYRPRVLRTLYGRLAGNAQLTSTTSTLPPGVKKIGEENYVQ